MQLLNNNWRTLKTNEYLCLEKTLFSGQIFSFIRIKNNEFERLLAYDTIPMSNIENKPIVSKKSRDKSLVDMCIQVETILESRNLNETHNDEIVYFGHLDNYIFGLKQEDEFVIYKSDHPNADKILINFFTLDLNYAEILKKFDHPLIKYDGLRLLRIEPIECILSFICSSMNNMKRISKMVLYLKKITNNFRSFELNYDIIETDLKNNGFGYRSNFLSKSLKEIKKLNSIDRLKKDEVKKYLLSLHGVGRKVCDCILLMGFSFFEFVPIDVHIFRVSKKIFNLEYKKLTTPIYRELQQKYYERFGPYCGIAQLYLFKLALDKNFLRKD